jgi:hypothetical protein
MYGGYWEGLFKLQMVKENKQLNKLKILGFTSKDFRI